MTIKHLDKAKLTKFQCVVSVITYEAITESLTKAAMKTKLHQIVIGDENVNVASQIRILIEGIDPRYKKLFIKINTDATSENAAGTKMIVAPLYSPNRDTKEIQVGTNLTFHILARAKVMTNKCNKCHQ